MGYKTQSVPNGDQDAYMDTTFYLTESRVVLFGRYTQLRHKAMQYHKGLWHGQGQQPGLH
jgi:hypothetical protein